MRRIHLAVSVVLLMGIVGGVLVAPASATTSDITVFATLQRFERGMMVYRSDSGFIWVLADNGQALGYASASYGWLPDNPVWEIPDGRVRPINGFGRIWGNTESVRNQLGYATHTEIGFQLRVQTVGDTTYLIAQRQFGGQIVQINANRTWHYSTTVPDVRITQFHADRGTVNPGDTLALTWDITGTDRALIEIYDPAGTLISFMPDLPIAGSTTITIPATVGDYVRIVLWGANLPRYYVPVTMYERVVQSSLTLVVRPSTEGSTTAYTHAVYQPYEHGFMLWREDTGEVLVFWGSTAGQWSNYPEPVGLPDNPEQVVRPGLVNPVNAFGRIWHNYDDVRGRSGWAIGPEQPYTLTVTTFSDAAKYAFRLPDGRTLYTTYGSWSF